MNNEQPIDQAASPEQRARDEWLSLLARLRAADANDARLQRVRRAIASGEWQIDPRAIAERLLVRLLTS